MATLDDVRARGFTVTIAWEGHTDGNTVFPDLYSVIGPGLSVYVADSPDTLDAFLNSIPPTQSQPTATPPPQ